MREVTDRVLELGATSSFAIDKILIQVVWNLYHREKDAGKLTVKVWFVSVDISDKLAELLMKWFGPDPLTVTR